MSDLDEEQTLVASLVGRTITNAKWTDADPDEELAEQVYALFSLDDGRVIQLRGRGLTERTERSSARRLIRDAISEWLQPARWTRADNDEPLNVTALADHVGAALLPKAPVTAQAIDTASLMLELRFIEHLVMWFDHGPTPAELGTDDLPFNVDLALLSTARQVWVMLRFFFGDGAREAWERYASNRADQIEGRSLSG